MMLLKTWHRGKFNFWIVGISYMRKRDAIIQRFHELQGRISERKRILNLLKELSEEKSGITLAGAIALIEGENK